MAGWGSKRTVSVVLVSLMMLMGLQVTPAVAADSFTGGVGYGSTAAAPLFAPNDHTAMGVRWLAAAGGGLKPNTNYFLKARFTVGETPSTSSNRGYTWNPDTGEWVQEHDSWFDFPVVTTDADGAILGDGGNGAWVFVKFGDETKSGEYHLMISLSETGVASTYNASFTPVLTVMDMRTGGGWVHNGLATGKAASTRIEITDPASSTICWTLSKTEGNLIDDDGNLVPDDEDYGPVGVTGDYRLPAPTDMPFDVRWKTATVLKDNFTHAYPDCDIAIGAADMVPPSDVTTIAATAQQGSILLDWDAATDDSSGIARYTIYRSEPSDPAAFFTPRASLVASVPAGTTEWTDTDVVTTEYVYEVRSVDESGNVGPRIATADPIAPMGLGEDVRTYGDDRYATAIAVSEVNFEASSVTTVVVATGTKFPDALAASGLAGCFGSPVLLVKDTVTAALTAEIDRLGATDVILVGGTSVISETVEDALAEDYFVERVFGDDRYATAAQVAEWVAASGGTTETAFVARGDDYADALAAAPFAWGQRLPVLLVKMTEVPLATSAAIDGLGIRDCTVVGGTAAVPAAVYDALEESCPGTLDRWFGADRYATAVDVADNGVLLGWGAWNYVGVATGKNFPDALGGGAATGANGGVMLLTKPDELPDATSAAVEANADSIDLLEVFGGVMAVSDEVYDALVALLP